MNKVTLYLGEKSFDIYFRICVLLCSGNRGAQNIDKLYKLPVVDGGGGILETGNKIYNME